MDTRLRVDGIPLTDLVRDFHRQMVDLKILLRHVFDGQRLSDEHVEGVLTTINAFRRDLNR